MREGILTGTARPLAANLEPWEAAEGFIARTVLRMVDNVIASCDKIQSIFTTNIHQYNITK